MLRAALLTLPLLLAFSSALAACAPPAPPVGEQQGADNTAPVVRLQLTTAQLQAGQQTFESFVLRADGQVHWAQWNSAGTLLAAARGQDPEAFAVLQQHPLWQRPAEATEADLLGRPAFYAELARLDPQRTELRSLEALDLSLSDLTARLTAALQPQTLTPGFYLWLTPQPPGADTQSDLDLNQPPADAQAVARALQHALGQGQTVVPVPEATYFQGERALRQSFAARRAGARLQFGLLSVAEPASGR